MWPSFIPRKKEEKATTHVLLPHVWWKRNNLQQAIAVECQRKKRLIVETLEPRVLLSADFPAIAPLFSGDINQLEDKLDNFLSYDFLNTALPIITLSKQIDAETLVGFAPTIDELLAIDISKGYANSGTDPVINLNLLDKNQDNKVTIQEFFSNIAEA